MTNEIWGNTTPRVDAQGNVVPTPFWDVEVGSPRGGEPLVFGKSLVEQCLEILQRMEKALCPEVLDEDST